MRHTRSALVILAVLAPAAPPSASAQATEIYSSAGVVTVNKGIPARFEGPTELLGGPNLDPLTADGLASADLDGTQREQLVTFSGADLRCDDRDTPEAFDCLTGFASPTLPAAATALVGMHVNTDPTDDLVVAIPTGLWWVNGGSFGPELEPTEWTQLPAFQNQVVDSLAAVDIVGDDAEELVALVGGDVFYVTVADGVVTQLPVPPELESIDSVGSVDLIDSGAEVRILAVYATNSAGETLVGYHQLDGVAWRTRPVRFRILDSAPSFEIDDLTGLFGGDLMLLEASVPSPIQFEDMASTLGIDDDFEPGGDVHCPGAVFADLDGDTDVDIYLPRGDGQANLLYLNTGSPDFGFTEDAAGLGIADVGNGAGAIAADFDNDGDRDLFVVNFNEDNTFYVNHQGTFSDETASTDPTPANPSDLQAGLALGWAFVPVGQCEDDIAPVDPCPLNDSLAAAAGDFNRDGWLDLYVGNHRFTPEGGDEFGQQDVLYFNDGNAVPITGTPSTFTDATLGSIPNLIQNSSQALQVADFNNDQWPDIYVTRKGHNAPGEPSSNPDSLYLNNADPDANGHVTFTDVFANLLVPGRVSPQAMGIDSADYDNDGDLDIYITDLGDMDLYENLLDGGSFGFDVPQGSNNPAPAPDWGWGTSWADFDNDTHLDLHLATNSNVLDWLYRSDGAGGFTDHAIGAGAGFARHSRISVPADYNEDGWPDLILGHRSEDPPYPISLLRNTTFALQAGDVNAALSVKLVGDPSKGNLFKSTADAIGAVIEVTSTEGGQTLRRDIRAGGHSCASTRSYIAHFGLADADASYDVTVTWPSGNQSFETVTLTGDHTPIEISESDLP